MDWDVRLTRCIIIVVIDYWDSTIVCIFSVVCLGFVWIMPSLNQYPRVLRFGE
jgi:hypothetical protein